MRHGEAPGFPPPITVTAATLIAAPPNHDNYREFMKKTSCKRLYMTNWTLDELNAVRGYIDPDMTEKDVSQSFAEVGGIVRHVFRGDFGGLISERNKKVNELSLKLLENIQGLVFGRHEVSPLVFTYDKVEDPYTEPPLRLLSLNVLFLVEERCKEDPNVIFEM
jgi:hypothetical protein